MDFDDPNETWQWLVKTGRASFERTRRRLNRIDTLRVLSGKNATTGAEYEMSLPAIGGDRNAGEGQGKARQTPDPHQAQWPANPRNNNAFVDPGQWPDSEPRPKRQPRSQVPRTAEQREANGPWWFFNTGGCIVTDCSNEHRDVIQEERDNIPEAWMLEVSTRRD
jgi:hypothetical protein